MTVLVTAASKYGSTWQIAVAIAECLERNGIAAEVVRLGEDLDPAGYEAVVVGSGVYAGKWLQSGRRFLTENLQALRSRPVWIFSSGPIGSPPRPAEKDAVHIESLVELVGAREHRLFTGELVHERLSLLERAVVKAVHVPDGDFRDWAAIDSWATQIAGELSTSAAVPKPVA